MRGICERKRRLCTCSEDSATIPAAPSPEANRPYLSVSFSMLPSLPLQIGASKEDIVADMRQIIEQSIKSKIISEVHHDDKKVLIN